MDIEESKILLKDFQKGKIEKDKLEHYRGSYKMGYFYTADIQEAIETVLSELEKKDKEIEKLKKDNKELLRKLRNRVKEVNKLTKYSLYKKEFSTLNKQLQNKDKVINEMAKTINKEYYKDIIENYTKKVEG